ncbi:MAG: D-alanyl-D-alanine carboxypeptidase [Alphaproteobacteria bacterium]|nr:D-alanyl-D-alanine carboxypeptidase [Alphaproteobacteria bacterium]
MRQRWFWRSGAALVVALLFLAAPALARYSALVVDAQTGRILIDEGADEIRYPASLTKLMTLYLVFDALDSGQLKLRQALPVSMHAAQQAPSKLGLVAGSTITVEEAILAVVTKSANDAAVVLAEAIGGDEDDFAETMTDRARDLGMRTTIFRNASGLPNPKQVTTARDMVGLGLAMLRNHQAHYHYFSSRSFNFRGQWLTTHNRMLDSYPGTDGMKTGFIQASGFNIVTSVERGGRRLVGTMFGGDTANARDRHMAALFDEGYDLLYAAAPMRTSTTYQAAARQEGHPTKASLRHAAYQPTAGTEKRGSHGRRAAEKPQPRTPSAGWGIQLGAFRAADAAYAHLTKVGKLAANVLDGTKGFVDPIKTKGKTVYRARIVGLTEQRAAAACKSLGRRQIDCIPIRVDV